MNRYYLKQVNQQQREEWKAREAFMKGMWLYGYCDGAFGPHSLEDKQILDVIGDVLEVKPAGGSPITIKVKSWINILNASNEELEKRERYS